MKIMFGNILIVILGGIAWAAPYGGPRDERLLDDHVEYEWSTTMGQLVKLATIAGIGTVVEKGSFATPLESDYPGYLKIRIGQPFFGCVSNQIITVMEGKEKEGGWSGPVSSFYFEVYPTNHGHIVFAAGTNKYAMGGFWARGWDQGPHTTKSYRTTTLPVFNYETRSWWYTDYQDGLPLAYFTNVVRTMRTQRNWTNYYAVCRDGASSSSVRVKEDSFHDLRFFTFHATDEQLQYIENDPLKTPDSITYIPHVRRVRQEREERTRQQESQ